jgi:hypothetical protein
MVIFMLYTHGRLKLPTSNDSLPTVILHLKKDTVGK